MSTFQKVLAGTALGDAIGNPLEFIGLPTNRDWSKALQGPFHITDDTQMALFCAQGMHWSAQPMGVDVLTETYLDWYRTQTREYKPGGRGLLAYPELYAMRAPGMTCMKSLGERIRNQERTRDLNDSKGNGTVMRCFPIGVLGAEWNWPLQLTADIAARDAKVTHDHQLAVEGSIFWSLLHYVMTLEPDLSKAVREVTKLCPFDVEPFTQYFWMGDNHFDRVRSTIGAWVAEEAVAVALRAVAGAENWLQAVKLAARIKGDSDTVGSMAGGLAAHIFPVPDLGPIAEARVFSAVH